MNVGERVIVRRRIEENKLAELQNAVSKNFHLGNIAKWEESSTILMNDKECNRKELELKKKNKLNLEIRKCRLRKLLDSESIIFKKEINLKIETGEQRRERLEKKAKELRTSRIARKEEFVKKQRLKQFRLKCDELRLNVGHNLNMQCHRIRGQQIKEKELKQQYDKKTNDKYLKIWKQELQKKINREIDESEYKKKLNYGTAKAIKQQIEEIENERNRNYELKQKEIEERINKLKQKEIEEKMNKIKKQKQLKIKREEIINEYKKYKEKKLNQQLFEKKMDKEFIEKILNEEKEENAEKEEKQKQNAENIENYLFYLNELKKKEYENDKLLSKLREIELEKEWNKKEIKWKKEELARKQLLQNVIDERMNQIELKKIIKNNNSIQNTLETKEILKNIKKYKKIENEKKQNKLKYNRQIQDFLKKQINEKKEIDKNYKNNQNHENHENHKIYSKLLKQETEKDKKAVQDGKITHHYPKTTANWWTF